MNGVEKDLSGSAGEQPFVVRRARTADVRAIRALVDTYAAERILLAKETVTFYEDIQEFWVAETTTDSRVVGCGALHVMWEDLAEVRTIATHPEWRRRGVGGAVLARLLEVAEELGISRLFCLTFEVDFFARYGFEPTSGPAVDAGVYTELLRSPDEGVAEFLDLDRVKPNTLGNVRMIRRMS
jgi:amino-acid N-acetyltransferase